MKLRVFDMFEQCDDKELTREKEGLGVGLYFVKRLCEKMDYEIIIGRSGMLGGAKVTIRGKVGVMDG
jgi:signal transduction histidine kinase